MEQINREEITKPSKWARLVYMLIYAFIFNFSIPFLFGFAVSTTDVSTTGTSTFSCFFAII